MQYLNLTKFHLFFNIISAVHILLPPVPQCLDSSGVEVLLLTLKKVPYSSQSDTCFKPDVFYVRKWKLIRWCQMRKIRMVINQLKCAAMHSGYWNYRLVCRIIVLLKRTPFLSFPGCFDVIAFCSCLSKLA